MALRDSRSLAALLAPCQVRFILCRSSLNDYARSSVVDRWFFGQILVSRSWLHVHVWRQAIAVRGLPISASGFALSRIGLASPIFSSTLRWWHDLATTVPGSSGYIDDGTHPGCCGYSPLTSKRRKCSTYLSALKSKPTLFFFVKCYLFSVSISAFVCFYTMPHQMWTTNFRFFDSKLCPRGCSIKLSVCVRVNLCVCYRETRLPYGLYPTYDTVYILNQHDHGSTFVHNSFAFILYVQKLLFDEHFESKNRKLVIHIWAGMV